MFGNVTDLQQRSPPIKYTSSCREDQGFPLKANSFEILHHSKNSRGVHPPPPPPSCTTGVWLCVYVRGWMNTARLLNLTVDTWFHSSKLEAVLSGFSENKIWVGVLSFTGLTDLLLSYGIESLSSGGVRLAKTNTPMLIIQQMIFLSEWIEPNVESKF